MKYNKRNKGFTLIEVMVVLIIGIIIIAVAAAGIGKVFASSEASTESRNINDLIAAAQVLKGGAGYPVDMIPTLRATDTIPTSLTDDGTNVTNSWDGAVTVAGAGNSFTISYAAVPAPACIQIAQKVAEAGSVTVNVGATAMDPASATALSAQATTACSNATSNAMTFRYN